jgi:ubiquinol-cytochrome c reductase core subunit 2
MDAVHKAAYRDSLGQPLYMNADRVGSFTPQALEAFVDKHYVSHNAVVLGVGVDHDALQHAARKLSVRPGPAPTPPKTKFHLGGEVRVDAPGRLVHAAVVYEGASLSSADLLSLSVMQYILGSCSPVQYGLNASSKLLKAGLSITNQPFTANCFSVNYTDSGLFGIYAVADMFDIGKVLRAAVNVMGQAVKSGFTDAEVQRAKARVKAGVQLAAEESSTLIELLTTQALYTNEPLTPKQLVALVDKVKTDDVNRVARQVTSGSPAMGAVGNLVNSPYLDELL